MDDLNHLKNWLGDTEKLAEVAGAILAARGIGEHATAPNVRLIRDYAQRGIISRAERQGKEAVYGFRQLLELVAARVLVADGWPLAKIAEQIVLMSKAEILNLLSGQPESLTPAQQAIRRLRAETPPVTVHRAPSSAHFSHRATQLSAMQSELRDALRKLGLPDNAPAEEQLTLIAVAPWCQILLESDRLNRLTIEEAETLGRALTAALLTRNRRK